MNYVVSDSSLTSVADAIRAKGQTSAALEYPDGFVGAINAIPTGGGTVSVPAKAVNFRDYDGTITNSYSKAEFLALSAMPANPSHDGLTAQGWNWSLADAQAYVTKYGRLEIGQMYITDDGKTRVYIHLEEGRTSPMLGVCPNGTIDVDWGDGTAHDTLTGTSVSVVKWTPTHHYAAPGDYVIKLTVTGKIGFTGNSSAYSQLLVYSAGFSNINNVYHTAIKKVEIGSDVTRISSYAFYRCYALESITFPSGLTNIGSSAFRTCYNLAYITIPSGTSVINSTQFQECYTLSSIALPNSISTVSNDSFNSCYNLACIIIPDRVTNIGQNAFYFCYGVAEYHLAPTTPPTLANTNAFGSIANDCIIYVPYSADHSVLNAYKTASGWSTYASKMQEEPT